MIVTNLAIVNFIEKLLHEHIMLLAHKTSIHPLLAHIKFTLVLANASLVIKTPLLDSKNHHIVLLLNHVLIFFERDHTVIRKLL